MTNNHAANAIENGLNIESDTIVMFNITQGKMKPPKEYIVLAVYDKCYNKTIGSRQWKEMKGGIYMVEDGVLERYDSIWLHTGGHSRVEVFQNVNGTDVVDVVGKYIMTNDHIHLEVECIVL